jgi:sigma-54 dependent transcriptional regulator, flagellar regulatory protein
MIEAKVLVIDSQGERAHSLKTVLEFIDCSPFLIEDCDSWTARIGDLVLDAIVVGEARPHQAAQRLFRAIKERDSALPVVLLGPSGEEAASSDLIGGLPIVGHIELPLRHAQVSSVLEQAQRHRAQREASHRRRPLELFRSLVGESPSIHRVRNLIQKVADSEANVLILGESGTGKEVVARNIHYLSARRGRGFVPINCGAIPGDLLESELFGHEKGAFTGAISTRQGRFELAEGGTLFLDEIGDMSLPMQVKLLRVLQERTFERVGSNKSMSADVRIVAATHRNLEDGIRAGTFREDLFYRLNVFPIEMPPLRERAEDVPLLVDELVARIEHEKRATVRLTPHAIEVLCQYEWPGNVRELANLVERLAILHPNGMVDVVDLPEKFRSDVVVPVVLANRQEVPDGQWTEQPGVRNGRLLPTTDVCLPPEGLDLKSHLSDLEVNLIKQALEEANGVVAHAANLLKMRRTTLVEKMRKYGLHRSDERVERSGV